jgi:hypothetical protein
MRAMRLSVCWALFLLAAVAGCTVMPEGEASFGTRSSADSGKQGFGFTSFGVSTFEDTNGDGLPDRRVTGQRPTTQVSQGTATSRSSPDPAANPLAGTFYNEGGEGDVRTRTENYFTTGGKDAAAPAKADQMMIYQGRVDLEVARVEDAIAHYLQKVSGWGGHLSTRVNAAITVRLPAARFQDAMAELRGSGRVLNESMQASDVTREHLDLGIRLENAQKSRDRLLALLQKAEKVEDMLKIEEQLRRLTEEIERMTGQLRFMNDQVAMSTITAAFQAVAQQPEDRRRTPNMFSWINQIGVEPLRRGF